MSGCFGLCALLGLCVAVWAVIRDQPSDCHCMRMNEKHQLCSAVLVAFELELAPHQMKAQWLRDDAHREHEERNDPNVCKSFV